MPSSWSLKGPSHPEEGKLINISLGYEVLPLCMKSFLCVYWAQQNYAETLADNLGLFACFQKRSLRRCLDYLLPFLCACTMFILLKL